MRRMLALLTALVLVCALAACGGPEPQSSPENVQPSQAQTGDAPSTAPSSPSLSASPEESQTPGDNGASDVLVAYFSATGNTEGIAGSLQTILDADLYEIVPEVPYTAEDLDYSTDDCRANREQNDPAARPALSGTLEHPEDYDVVFLGYPIWWGQAPKIIYTFLETYDFGDAVIVPFCTSGSSGISGSLADLQALTPDASWLDGQRFSAGAGQDEIAQWVEGLDLPESSGAAD